MLRNGRRRAFHVGSNSLCRQHIRSHYDIYKTRCNEQGLKAHHHAIPQEMLKKEMRMGQQTLAEAFQKVLKLKEFSREAVVRAVGQFVVCDDQVRILGSVP